jgi:Spy/CpxP family protein refolding chaperone
LRFSTNPARLIQVIQEKHLPRLAFPGALVVLKEMTMKWNRRIILASMILFASPAWSQMFGMGPGMMGQDGMMGYGGGMGYGMGPGMMGGYGPGNWNRGAGIPNLTDEQRSKLMEANKEFRQKQWQLMEKMHDLGFQGGGLYRNGRFDEQAARKQYDAMAALRKQMFENYLDEQKRIDSILTPQQREQVQRSWGG